MSHYNVLYILILKSLEAIPYKGLFYIGKVLGLLLYILPNKHKRISKANLELVFPQKTSLQINSILRDSLFHSIMNILEAGLVWGKQDYKKKPGFINVKNFSEIETALSSDKGILLFTPHIGNIEIIINFLGQHTDCTIPYTQPKHKGLDKIITNSRNKSGVKMVDINVSGIKEMLAALKNKKLAAVASDQVPKKGAGIISKFFNNEIYSMTLLPKLQQRTGCVAHLMYCERKEKGKGFVIHFDSKIDLSSNIQEGVDKMNNEFEKCIMKLPGQYSWEYKKFKRTELDSIYK
jgi:KDO2-lipid IV(A) lauroyltransferase|tara:strand:+ start:624 stop:1499 length:876 start_codon:yes stop_codon:yes gene_type:complete